MMQFNVISWFHIKCRHLNYIDYKYLLGCNEPWYCLSCTNTLFSFSNLINQNFLTFISDNNTISTISNETKSLNSSLLLKPAPDLAFLFNQFNNATPENRSDPKNVIQSIL